MKILEVFKVKPRLMFIDFFTLQLKAGQMFDYKTKFCKSFGCVAVSKSVLLFKIPI